MLSEQERVRRASLAELQTLGIDPFPAPLFAVNTTAEAINTGFDANAPEAFAAVQLAGRLMGKRIMGNASFAELQDQTGKVQIYLRRDDLCTGEDKTLYNIVFKKLIDIGDIVGVEGFVFRTQTGEISVHVREFTLLTKSLKPLPVVKEVENEDGTKTIYDAFTDPEMRYRQRYLDMIVNPEVRDVFKARSKVVQTMRNYLIGKDYLEVETPILQPLYGGAAARPFKTYHNTLDMPLYLRIANELYLKRLIVGGFEGVFEFAKDFRNEGMSRFHNPEFTQMELYVAYKDYNWMMDLVEEMVETIVIALHGHTKIVVGEKEIDFARPWKRVTMYDSIAEFTGIDISALGEEELIATCKQLEVPINPAYGKGKLIDAIFGEKVEPYLSNPTFITDYPMEMSPLAKKHRSKPGLVERFEAICNGKEICNAFSELNDPLDQRARFEEQVALGARGDDEAMVIDEDFLRALEYGMPPTAGLGIGIDRLTMIVANQKSIQDVLFFPQMKAESGESAALGVDYAGLGVPAIWVEAFQLQGFASAGDFKAANPNKVFNELGGYRKKRKLEDKVPSTEEIKSWQAAVA